MCVCVSIQAGARPLRKGNLCSGLRVRFLPALEVGRLRAPDTYVSSLSVFNLDQWVWGFTCSQGHNSCHIWDKLRSL